MDHLRRLGDRLSIPIKPDEDGFTGRECPQPNCEGYFKIEFGTGLKGEGLPCHCPYCGHAAGHDHFWTREQIAYAESVAMRKITDAVHKDLKKMEFDHKPKGLFGIGISLKVEPGRRTPIRSYREKELETELVCSRCTLRYSVYGVFAFCPDCGQHNSLQILDKNLEVVGKMLALAATAEKEIAQRLMENALEDCVSSFDGFGRELCRILASTTNHRGKLDRVSFQNLQGARATIQGCFGVDMASLVTATEWQSALRGCQKRHIVAHKMGIVDQDYINSTSDAGAVRGRRAIIDRDEVEELLRIFAKLARNLTDAAGGRTGPSEEVDS